MFNFNLRYFIVIIPTLILGFYFLYSKLNHGVLYAWLTLVLGIIIYIVWVLIDKTGKNKNK